MASAAQKEPEMWTLNCLAHVSGAYGEFGWITIRAEPSTTIGDFTSTIAGRSYGESSSDYLPTTCTSLQIDGKAFDLEANGTKTLRDVCKDGSKLSGTFDYVLCRRCFRDR